MIKANAVFQAIAKSPILWGVLVSVGFFGLVDGGPLGTEFIKRYFAGHPVEYAETTLFFVGLAALVLKAIDALGQRAGLSLSPLGPTSRPAAVTDEHCKELLARLDRLPARRQNDCLVRRLRAAVEHLRRRGSAESLDDELKYLADLDSIRLHASYGLFRVIIWAIPILGFLGTVIGITIAIANLNLQGNSLLEVTAGLGVAFDTTTLALSLSIVLMTLQFLTDRLESRVLAEVDRRVADELEGRFEQLPPGPDGQVVALRRMTETVVLASERLVKQQAELWQASMEAAARRWTQMADTAGAKLQTALSAALTESLKGLAHQSAAAAQVVAEQNHRHWEKVQQAQSQTTQVLATLEAGMIRQAEVLGRAADATGEVTRLQDALNHNLAALAGAKHFEQTVMSLAAAIQLLNARLTEGPLSPPAVQLDPGRRAPRAA